MQPLNIVGDSSDWRAKRLSNFSNDPFDLDGETFASVEGFIQGIKFPPNHPARLEAFQSVGMKAKKLGRGAQGDFVWFRGTTVIYGSPEHHGMIGRAMCAKFEQNREAMVALIATEGQVLTHDVGHPDSPKTSLPCDLFCAFLTEIRQKVLAARLVIKVVGPHGNREARMKGFTGTGATTPEAIGNLVMAHPERFNLKLDLKY